MPFTFSSATTFQKTLRLARFELNKYHEFYNEGDSCPGCTTCLVALPELSEAIASLNPPKRIWMRRKKGWRMPENTITCTRRGKWHGRYGNPLRVGSRFYYAPGRIIEMTTKHHTLSWFRKLVLRQGVRPLYWTGWHEGERSYITYPSTEQIEKDLSGLNLACYCRLCPKHEDGRPLGVECTDCEPCHVDILLKVANRKYWHIQGEYYE